MSRANVFHGFKVAGNILGGLPHLMSARKEKARFAVAAVKASIKSISPTYTTFLRGWSHISYSHTVVYNTNTEGNS